MQAFEEYKQSFFQFYNSIKKGYEESSRNHRGHGFDHDLTVATLAVHISPGEHTAHKAWCAAMLHSTDRLFENKDNKTIEKTMRVHLEHLPKETFLPEEIDEIVASALRHAELNQENQSLTQQILMDADRLANLMLTCIIRSGQFRPEIPAFEFEYFKNTRNPNSTYKEPLSVLDNIRLNVHAYVPQLRIEKAKEIAKKYVDELNKFIEAF